MFIDRGFQILLPLAFGLAALSSTGAWADNPGNNTTTSAQPLDVRTGQ